MANKPLKRQRDDSASARIRMAKRSNAIKLDLSELRLETLPASISQLENLNVIVLCRNKFVSCPESIGKLLRLRSLDLSFNKLIDAPGSIGTLAQLETLNLGNNRLTAIPQSLGCLTTLTWLNLERNELVALPDPVRRLTQLQSLNLGHNGLKTVPEWIGELTNLQTLNLCHNGLAYLPESIRRLTRLESLNLGFNSLKMLPEWIGDLESLQALDLSHSGLAEIPHVLARFPKLKLLDLNGNRFTELPAWFGNLIELQHLDLNGAALTTLPESIGHLAKLKELGLSGNELTTLPQSIGRLGQLQALNLGGNRLASLPDTVGKLSQLQTLELMFNNLKSLPQSIGQLVNLQSLDLSFNSLASLPESITKLSRLMELYLHENDGIGIPPEILGPKREDVILKKVPCTEPAKILKYYFQLRSGQRPLNEAKLILVGRGGVGKTSLVNRLLRNEFDRIGKKTEGILIAEWKLRLKDAEDVSLHVWDFGGQEIMHATHQFFLTQRSIYLLVLSGREGTEEMDAEYWLRLIESFGAESSIIIVMNKIKEHFFDLNRRAFQLKYPAIQHFIQTDCEDGTGLKQLRAAIETETDHLEHLRDPFPLSWLSIKERLAGLSDNFLTFEKYREICRECGESNEGAQESLASYLHSLGIALNYKDNLRLRDMHVLSPQWVTNGIYKILNSQKLAEQKGVLQLSDVGSTLNAVDYPRTMHNFLIDLMKKFEICFGFSEDDSRYLIPELLDQQQPVEAEQFEPTDCLSFQYHYPILPSGLLPRFIVRTQSLSKDCPRWRTGVILEFEGNRALIKADALDKKVFISVAGPMVGRRRLLAVIRSDFDRIHRDIAKLDPQEIVPVPGHPDVLVTYRELQVMEKDGIKSFPKVVNGKIIKLNVNELLSGVDVETAKAKGVKTYPLRLFYSYSHKD